MKPFTRLSVLSLALLLACPVLAATCWADVTADTTRENNRMDQAKKHARAEMDRAISRMRADMALQSQSDSISQETLDPGIEGGNYYPDPSGQKLHTRIIRAAHSDSSSSAVVSERSIRREDEIIEQRKQIDSLAAVVRRLERRLKAVEGQRDSVEFKIEPRFGGGERGRIIWWIRPDYCLTWEGAEVNTRRWARIVISPAGKDHIDHVEMQLGGMEKSKARELARKMLVKWRLAGSRYVRIVDRRVIPIMPNEWAGQGAGVIYLMNNEVQLRDIEDLLAEAIGTGRMKAEGTEK